MSNILLIGGAGYIGSFLLPRLIAEGFLVDVCDTGSRGFVHGPVRYPCSYAALTHEELAPYDDVLWFGGHSSVSAAINDPWGALGNNCLDMVALRTRLRPDARLIYASTASLYSAAIDSSRDDLPLSGEDRELVVNINAYDMSKFVFDYIAKGFLKNFIGLRLGTVSGFSPNLRPELLFNAMNISALREGRVCVANPQAFRSILFLDDLYQAVRACLTRRNLEDGFFNLASATLTVGELGGRIAVYHGARIETLPPSPTYSFRLDTSKAEEQLGVRFGGDIAQRCAQFITEFSVMPPTPQPMHG